MEQTGRNEDMMLASRRRMLKLGAAALPVAMTLHSGAAQAMTSWTCGTKAQDSQDWLDCPPAVTCTQDGWYRLPCDTYSQKTKCNLGGTTTWVDGTTGCYYVAKCNDGSSQWRNCRDFSQCSGSPPSDCGSQVNSWLGLVQIDCTTGEVAACGIPHKYSNCIYTSAAGNCINSLQQHARWG